ncbi:MAG TPA: hypothetical protein VK149_09185, partial [Sideroxyarcus sp.]|nr:hypothetical protein [Sideroxyarcus sp.]
LLSGGFPLLRMHQGEFEPVHTLLLGRAMNEPLVAGASAWPMTRHRLATFSDNPGLAKWAGTMGELGLLEQLVPETQGQRIGLILPNGYFTHPSSSPLPQNLESYCAFVHLSEHAEHFFHSRETLERRIAWAIEHPEQRDRFSRESAQKARSRKTYDALANDVLSFVRDRLSGRSR